MDDARVGLRNVQQQASHNPGFHRNRMFLLYRLGPEDVGGRPIKELSDGWDIEPLCSSAAEVVNSCLCEMNSVTVGCKNKQILAQLPTLV